MTSSTKLEVYNVLHSRQRRTEWTLKTYRYADRTTLHTSWHHTTTPQPFYGHFSGTTPMSWCQKRTSGLYGARED